MEDPGVSPVRAIHSPGLRNWILLGHRAKNPVDIPPLLDQIRLFVKGLKAIPTCVSIKNCGRELRCSCFHDADLSEDGIMDRLVRWMFEFALKQREEQITIIVEWMKYSRRHEIVLGRVRNQLSFIIPGTASTHICKDSLARLLGFGHTKWETCTKISKGLKTAVHGQVGKRNGRKQIVRQALCVFLNHMKKLAAPRATLFIRGLVDDVNNEPATSLQRLQMKLKQEKEVLELPSSTSKRSVYGRFLHERGWKYKIDHKGSASHTEPVDGMEQQPVCSWSMFVQYWNKMFPLLIIARPREDICGECYIYANRHKYLSSRLKKKTVDDQQLEGDVSDDEEGDEYVIRSAEEEATTTTDNQEDSTSGPGDNDSDPSSSDDIVIQQEELILKAAKHVEMARIQRKYYQDKKQEAVDTANLDPSQRCLCFVADYAQNMGVPSFGYEQPGETYYYSPMNAYCFGVVDCSKTPEMLTSYVYTEDQAKKGGNNVVSLLWLHLQRSGIVDTTTPYKEITFIFDNCGGQNKNRMVLRFLFFIVKMKIAYIARAAFLIRGHTKNDCDRLFNLMKKHYRKANIYTPNDLMKALRHDQVEPVQVGNSSFQDWDALEERFIRRPVGVINRNHMFEVNSQVDNGNSLTVAEAFGYNSSALRLVQAQYLLKEADFWKQLPTTTLTTLKPTGIQDIKWKELHDKWAPLIPEEKKKEWIYYSTDLSSSQRANIAANSKKSKATRQERSRTSQQQQPVRRNSNQQDTSTQQS